LIVYDPDILKEKEIITWLSRIHELIIQALIKREKDIDQDAIDRIASQLTEEGYALERFEQTTTA